MRRSRQYSSHLGIIDTAFAVMLGIWMFIFSVVFLWVIGFALGFIGLGIALSA